ncbi:hypothetical protein IMZ48_29385, partial [Candidatus Bathyarchaeota archaeon]|nr:hypothetical protein [Candidatus Bathyarchaeota archaeon]
MTPQKRRLHLIDKHTYPKNFFFALTKEGIDGRNSLLLEAGHRRRKPHPKSQPKGAQTKDGPGPGPGSGETHGGDTNVGEASEAADRGPSGSPPSDGDAGSPSKEED